MSDEDAAAMRDLLLQLKRRQNWETARLKLENTQLRYTSAA